MAILFAWPPAVLLVFGLVMDACLVPLVRLYDFYCVATKGLWRATRHDCTAKCGWLPHRRLPAESSRLTSAGLKGQSAAHPGQSAGPSRLMWRYGGVFASGRSAKCLVHMLDRKPHTHLYIYIHMCKCVTFVNDVHHVLCVRRLFQAPALISALRPRHAERPCSRRWCHRGRTPFDSDHRIV